MFYLLDGFDICSIRHPAKYNTRTGSRIRPVLTVIMDTLMPFHFQICSTGLTPYLPFPLCICMRFRGGRPLFISARHLTMFVFATPPNKKCAAPQEERARERILLIRTPPVLFRTCGRDLGIICKSRREEVMDLGLLPFPFINKW